MSFLENADPNFDGVKINHLVNGLADFTSTLEKDFFAEVEIQTRYYTESKRTDLVLDIYCNYGITESLHYFNIGNWGGFKFSNEGVELESSFQTACEELNRKNNNSVDIVEASVHFKDTSIIISRLHQRSISEQIGKIMCTVSEHFVYFTKGLTQMPYEIFIAVYEEKRLDSFELEKSRDNYFNYWGLYFEDLQQHCVMVYDLNRKKLFKEHLFLFE
ncbi:hypothetical protein [Flagellimonas nanhaiensis]|uniref:Uncharacterized protein n=1 Tax=Flagellimonas nanhaiensis TaxID=2292706 RepID=A0A371JU93_9FLAO|nr:hypothetical protein [Allomuricauda nanhaiensis]RDY61349.1 hypothetical protein DX873_04065 [Allomuricauda nanhaiensis]